MAVEPAGSVDRDESSESMRLLERGVMSDDLHGQLRDFLVRAVCTVVVGLVDARPIFFGPVFAAILVYLLCISALDYFVLRRIRRFPWTWITFPLMIAVFGVVSFVLFYRGRLGDLARYEVTCRDIGVDGRGRTWAMACVVNNANRPVRIDGDRSAFTRHMGQSEIVGQYYGYTTTDDDAVVTDVRHMGGRTLSIPAHVGQHVFLREDSVQAAGQAPFTANIRCGADGRLGGSISVPGGEPPAVCVVYHNGAWYAATNRNTRAGAAPANAVLELDAAKHDRDFISDVESLDQMFRYSHVSTPERPLQSMRKLLLVEPAWTRKRWLEPQRSALEMLGNGKPVVVALFEESASMKGLKIKRLRCVRQVVEVGGESSL
jgi:hypothetical protein